MESTTDPLPAGSPAGHKPRLLVVEDTAFLSAYLKQVLQPDYEVEVAVTGTEAWEAIQAGRCDLVISDILMPGLDGIALTRKIRAHPPTAKLPVVLTTGSSREEIHRRALESGADGVLFKPFTLAALFALVRRCLERLSPE